MSAAQRRYDAWRAALLGEETREEMFFRRVAYERARTRALGAEWARGDDVDARRARTRGEASRWTSNDYRTKTPCERRKCA